MDILISSLWVAMVLYFLYETSVVYSYLDALPKFVHNLLNPLIHFKDYKWERDHYKNWSLSYSDYMATNHGGFLTSLFSCRYCFGFWLALISSYFCGLFYLPVVYFLSQLGYSVFKVADKYLMDLGESNHE